MGDGDAENADSSCKRVLLGNKCDVPDSRRAVPYQRAAQLSQQLQLPHFETSAVTGVGVDDAFRTLGQLILQREEEADYRGAAGAGGRYYGLQGQGGWGGQQPGDLGGGGGGGGTGIGGRARQCAARTREAGSEATNRIQLCASRRHPDNPADDHHHYQRHGAPPPADSGCC
jgi:hypothetical protein